MSIVEFALMTIAVAVVAFLYSSVGHAGASGYIAVMTLAGLEPQVIRPTALVLNIVVAAITSWQFARRGHFCWGLFWPFAILAVPMAYWGGSLTLSPWLFQLIVGLVLLYSAARFMTRLDSDEVGARPPMSVAIPTGAGLGLLAGLTGTGGGIFLTPLLIVMRWSTTQQAAGVSSLFILLNSVAGLTGNVQNVQQFPLFAIPMAAVAVGSGFAGSHFGSHKFPHTTIKRLLAIVLAIAGSKLLLTAL
jgi:hypothetical protein